MRTLNEKQLRALDRLDDRDPEAVVIGWSDKVYGPTVQRGDGQIKHLSHTGYLRKNES